MKYIRTKNAIYDLKDLRLWKIPFMIVDDVIDFNSAGRHKIIDRADTIEELCDEFVSNHVVLSKQDIKDILKYAKDELKEEIIYGAIWTDKGLIYVAKMNDKGELELL